jgi:hypothetical protein
MSKNVIFYFFYKIGIQEGGKVHPEEVGTSGREEEVRKGVGG